MKHYFDLDAGEKRVEWILIFLFLLFALIIATGVYTQSYGINYDRLLTPSFFIVCGTFFTFYGFNGFQQGNLIVKWTPFYIYGFLKFLLAKIGSFEAEKAAKVARKVLGAIGILIAIVNFSFALWDIFKQ